MSAHEIRIGTPAPDEVGPLETLLGLALHSPMDSLRVWLDILGPDNLRAARLGDKLAGGLGLARFAQWFGGRSVPMVGITIVGVAPEHRGSGVGTALMRSVVQELHAEGVPISALYPATLTFYQRVGYDRAGSRFLYEMPLDAIRIRETSLQVEQLTPEQLHLFHPIYDECARRSAGNIDRPEWAWRRRLDPKERQRTSFLVRRGERAEGYVAFTQGLRTDPLTVLDMSALTPAAGRQLLSLLVGYASIVEKIRWVGGPFDAFAHLLDEPRTGLRNYVQVLQSFEWMLRILDVPRALEARGYPPALHAELHVDVSGDDILPSNVGRFVARIADGRARVEPGGEGRIRLGIRELASLYTGFMSAYELRALGNLDGSDADLELATAVFAGPRPWISDMF